MPDADRAGAITPPPLIYAAVFAVGYVLDRSYPVSLRPDASAGWLGWAILAAASASSPWAGPISTVRVRR